MSSPAWSIPFADHGSPQQSGHDGGPRIVAATDPALTGLGDLLSRGDDRLYIAAFAGSQRTGGYAIRVAGVDRAGDTLTVATGTVTGRPFYDPEGLRLRT